MEVTEGDDVSVEGDKIIRRSKSRSRKKKSRKKKPQQTKAIAPTEGHHAFKLARANVLVVGSTGSGKTTFVRALKDPTYTHEHSASSTTEVAETNTCLFKIGGLRYWALNVIDTPGFGDSSARQTSDLDLESLILNFVKRDVTSLNLVLIAIPLGQRLEKSQIDTILNTMLFLGADMKKCTGILFTFADGIGKAERKKLVAEYKCRGTPLRSIYKFCEKGHFFSGVCTNPDPIKRQGEINRQKKRQLRVIEAAINAEPTPLVGERYTAIASRFTVFESAAKDSLLLQKVVAELPALAARVEELRGMVAESARAHEQEAKYADLIAGCSSVSVQKVQSKSIELSKLQAAMDEYTQMGGELTEAASSVQKLHSELSLMHHNLRAGYRNLVLQLPDGSEAQTGSGSDADP